MKKTIFCLMTAAVISLFAFSCTKEPNKPVNPDNPENPDNPDTPTELKLTFNISDIEYTDAAITIKSNMSDTSFVYFVTEAKEFESIKDNDERFEKDMDILNELSLQLGYITPPIPGFMTGCFPCASRYALPATTSGRKPRSGKWRA